MENKGRIIVITGLPGAGKSSTSALLAQQFEKTAHIEADRIQELIISGAEHPTIDGASPEAIDQLQLRLRNSVLLAKSFSKSGFTAIVDDIVHGNRFDQLIEDLQKESFYFIVLLRDLETLKQEWRDMNSPFAESWDWIDEDLRGNTPRVGLWLDTTNSTLTEVVEQILIRLEEGLVTAYSS